MILITEVGVAYVRLLPSMQGFSGAATRGLTAGLAGPSREAGRRSGEGFVTSFGSALDRGGQRISRTGDKLTKGLTLPLLGLGAVAFSASKDFNAGMANVATLIPGNTARVEELSTGVRGLAIDMGKSTGDMTEGLYNVISAFGDSSESMSLLEINAKAATAGMATTTDAINLTSAVTKGYGDTSAEAVQKASDLALLTVRMGQTTFPELAGSIGSVIPLAENLGVTQEELFASMATFTGVTGGASEVATQMRGALQGLMAPSTDAAAAIEEAGFASGAAAVEELGLAGAVGLLTDAAAESGQPLQDFMGSIEGQTFALGLAGSQAEDYETKLAEMAGAQGTTNEAFTEATEGVNAAGFQWDQAKAKANDLMIELGNNLAPVISSLLDAATPLIAGLGTLSEKFESASPTAQKFVAGLLGFLIAVGPVMSVVGRMTSGIGKLVKGIDKFGRGSVKAAKFAGRMGTGLGKAGVQLGRLSVSAGKAGGKIATGVGRAAASFGRLSAQAAAAAGRVVASFARMAVAAAKAAAKVVAQIAIQIAKWVLLGVQALLHAAKVALAWLISMGPIGLIIAAVIGLTALIVANFDKIKRAIAAAFNWVKTNWPLLLGILLGPFGLAAVVIIKHRDKIWGAVKAVFRWVKNNWPKVLFFLVAPFAAAAVLIGSKLRVVRNAATGVKNWVVGRFNALVGFVRGLPGRISSAASGMWDGIKTAFKAVLNTIIGWWNGIGFTLPVIDIPSVSVPGFGTIGGGSLGGQTFSTPNITPLAAGGIVSRPTLAVVGDTRGDDEAVAPLKELRSMVFDAAQQAALRSSHSASGGNALEMKVSGGQNNWLAQIIHKSVRDGDLQMFVAGKRVTVHR